MHLKSLISRARVKTQLLLKLSDLIFVLDSKIRNNQCQVLNRGTMSVNCLNQLVFLSSRAEEDMNHSIAAP
jgi:hypothetical protein